MSERHNVEEVNSEVKDTFFKVVYRSTERLQRLAAFLIGRENAEITVTTLDPVLYGNKENDLSFSCDGTVYVMMEEQSTVCLNIPFRMAEYMMTTLRDSVDTKKLLYGSRRVMLPVPKLFVLNVGVVKSEGQLPECVEYDLRLSDSFPLEDEILPDLEAVVHAYDFRMSRKEVVQYLELGAIPVRVAHQLKDLLDYALTANCLTYIQQALQKEKQLPLPERIRSVADLIELLIKRDIFVDLLTRKEVCNMAAIQFSREEMIEYQGWEAGLEEGIERGIQRGRIETYLELGYSPVRIAGKLGCPIETVYDVIDSLQKETV